MIIEVLYSWMLQFRSTISGRNVRINGFLLKKIMITLLYDYFYSI